MRVPVLLLSLALLSPACAHGQAFVHPGILLDASALQATRDALRAGDPLKTSAMVAMQQSPLASLEHVPTPFVRVECGSFDKPSIGCKPERDDAKAAYTHALLWAYLGEPAHARKAVQIMDAWATTLTGGHHNSNAPLQASWTAQLWTRAAELIRHTSTAWPEADARRFGDWLIAQYLPDINRMGPCPGGNWHASGIEARMNMGIYTDRRDIHDRAVGDWNARLPTYVYLPEDGATPLPRPACATPIETLWFGQTVMAAGLAEETCRDLEHTAYGLAAYLNAAETNRLQGGSLYQAQAERLVAAMEFHTDMLARPVVPAWLCKGKLVSDVRGTLEIGYSHFAGRQGKALPHTAAWLAGHRPSQGDFHFLWETLTHGTALGE